MMQRTTHSRVRSLILSLPDTHMHTHTHTHTHTHLTPATRNASPPHQQPTSQSVSQSRAPPYSHLWRILPQFTTLEIHRMSVRELSEAFTLRSSRHAKRVPFLAGAVMLQCPRKPFTHKASGWSNGFLLYRLRWWVLRCVALRCVVLRCVALFLSGW